MNRINYIWLTSLFIFVLSSCTCDNEVANVTGSNFINTFRVEHDAIVLLEPDSSNRTLEGILPINSNGFFFGGIGGINKNDSFHVLLRMFLNVSPERSKCNLWFGNSIDSNSYRLTCSPSFAYNGKEIKPTYNLLNLRSIDGAPAILQPIWESEKVISCLIRNVFFDESNFGFSPYLFTLQCKTDDDILILQRLQINIR